MNFIRWQSVFISTLMTTNKCHTILTDDTMTAIVSKMSCTQQCPMKQVPQFLHIHFIQVYRYINNNIQNAYVFTFLLINPFN